MAAKIALGIIGAGIVFALWYGVETGVFSSASAPADSNSGTEEALQAPSSDAVSYFRERLTTRGIADVGQPIEGFDAALLERAYPGLLTSDFDGVAALEGHYSVRGEDLAFVRTEGLPVSSAAQAVSDAGYETLLRNVSRRLEVAPENQDAIDAIIERINTAETLRMRIDQGASAFGVKIVPVEVTEDSRCPADVACIQAGTVRVRALVTENGTGSEKIFTLNEPVRFDAVTVVLADVTPFRHEGADIDATAYQFDFRVGLGEDFQK